MPGFGVGVGVGLEKPLLAGGIESILGDTGRVYLDYNDIAVADAADVTTWTNRFTGYGDLTEATNPPSHDESIGGVYFDGVSGILSVASIPDMSEYLDVWILIKSTSVQNLKAAWHLLDGNSRFLTGQGSRWTQAGTSETYVEIETISTTSWQWVRCTWGGGSGEGVVNDTVVDTSPRGIAVIDNLAIGGGYGTAGSREMWAKHFILSSGATSAQRAAVDAWIDAEKDAA